MYRIVICLCAALCLWGCEETLVNEDSTPQPVQVVEQPSGVGFGLETLPYTVWQVLRGAGRTTDVWVAGYVVGYADNSIANAHFDAYGAGETNILLAARADETDRANVLTVQLSSSQARQLFSLAHNPAGLGRAVSLHAALIDKYCYALGLRGVDRGVWIAAPQSVNLDYGCLEPGDEEDKPGEGGESGSESGSGEVTGDVHYYKGTGDDVFWVDGIETPLEDVTKCNTGEYGGRSSCPCFPNYVIQFYERNTIDGVESTENVFISRWYIGYVKVVESCTYITTTKEDISSDKSFILDLDAGDMSEWMQRKQNPDRLIRICGTLKFKGQRWHVRNIESLDWLRESTDN